MAVKRSITLLASLCLIFFAIANQPVLGIQKETRYYSSNSYLKKVVTLSAKNSATKVSTTWVRISPSKIAVPSLLRNGLSGQSTVVVPITGINAGSPGGPSVQGSDGFKQRVAAAISLLQTKAPSHWEMVKNNLTAIVEGTSSGVNVLNGVFSVGPGTAQSDPVWLAGTIVHDAYHVSLFRSGQVYMGESGERAALSKQKEALILMGAPAYMIQHVDQVANTRYWEVPAGSRTW